MGVVWRATDTSLGRDVAIKVLPDLFAHDPERLARFEREARLLATLNHPHIAAIYGLHALESERLLVMELVEGEDLSQRLARGALPLQEALALARQVAEALEYAHEKGVIHRDLKPANVKLTPGGQIKVLDFGLAKALEEERFGPAPSNVSQSPTITAHLTSANVILGTAAYMSPEQARGQAADRRADVWAFGVLFYEMLSGRQLFEGETVSDTLASVLKSEPDWSRLPKDLPASAAALLRRCLTRDPKRRLRDIGEARIALEDAEAGVADPLATAAPAPSSRGGPGALALAGAGLLTGALLALAAAWSFLGPRAPVEVTRFEVPSTVAAQEPRWPRLSPDGRLLAFLAADSAGTQRIWIRPLDAIEAHALPGTESAGRPFWSPDGQYLAYFVGGKLKKVAVAGGPPVTLADTPGGSDGSWGRQGIILFDGGAGDSIRMVPASGGVVRPVTAFDRGKSELLHSWPYFLPDGRHFLYEVDFSGGRASAMKVGDVGSKQTRELGPSDGRVEYTAAGYIVFLRERTLLAQSFDARALKTRGDPFPIAENVVVSGEAGNFSLSQRGDLVFRSEPNSEQSLLVWLDRDGKRLGFAAPPGPYQDIALSPDASLVAVSQMDPATNHNDIWVRQLARGVSTRLTFAPSDEIWPVWSPDGTRLAYASDRGGEFRPYTRLVSGVGAEDSLGHQPGGNEGPTDWSQDGHWLLTSAASPSTRWDIWMTSAEPGAKPALWLQTPFVERDARFSPDGRWVAYTSNESGHPEVYARPASGSNGKWQVSSAGGSFPHWRRDGKELFYQTPERSIVAVPIHAGEALEIGTPVTLFEARLFVAGYSGPRWDVTADGQRFLVNTTPGDAGSARLTVVRNWAVEAKKR